MEIVGRDIKPVAYRHSYTAKQPIPYSAVDGAKGNQASRGTLQIGRVVWLDTDLQSALTETIVRAFVDGIGLIQVNPSSLSAAC